MRTDNSLSLDATKWPRRFLDLAEHIAGWSRDPSTKVGAVLVDNEKRLLATGYNGFPRGVRDLPERLADRDAKLRMTVHAEQNALLTALRHGVSVLGATCYVTRPPCGSCAAALIQAGVVRVVHPPADPEFARRWADDLSAARTLFAEAGVEVVELADGNRSETQAQHGLAPETATMGNRTERSCASCKHWNAAAEDCPPDDPRLNEAASGWTPSD